VRRNLDQGRLTDPDIDTQARFEAKVLRDPESIRVAVVDNEVLGNVFIVEDGWTGFVFRLAVASTHRDEELDLHL